MVRLLAIVFALVDLIFSRQALSATIGKPYAIRISNLRSLRERDLQVASFTAEFLHDEAMMAKVEEWRLRLADQPNTWCDPEGFEPVVGHLYFISNTGRIETCGFRTVSGPESFQKFIESEMLRRGSDTILEGDQYQVTITNPSPPKAPAGKPTIRWIDSYYSYNKGVVFSGSRLAHDVDANAVIDAIDEARGKDTYIRIQPQEVNFRHRMSLLNTLTGKLFVNMQRRDGEADGPYFARREVAKNYIDAFNAVLNDVESLTAWEVLPMEDRPYQAVATLVAKNGTTLDQFLRQLYPQSSSAPAMIDSRIMSGSLNCTLPELMLPSAQALLKNSSLHETPLGESLLQTINDRKFDLTATFDMQPDSSAVLAISADVAGGQLQAEQLSASLGSGKIEGTICVVPLKLAPLEEKLSVDVYLKQTDSRLIGVVGSNNRESIEQLMAADENEQIETGSGTFFSMTVDLAPAWADEDSNAEILRQFEEAYQKWQFYSYSTVQRRFMFGKLTPLDRFRSLIDKSSKNGDWKLKASARVNDGTIFAQCTVGSDLYYLFRCRQKLTAESLTKDEQ